MTDSFERHSDAWSFVFVKWEDAEKQTLVGTAGTFYTLQAWMQIICL